MFDGCALHEMIFDADGNPVDYRFLDVNPAFERITGTSAKAVLGRTVSEVLPVTEPHWIQAYGRVVVTGEPCRFEHYHAGLAKYFEVVAFRVGPKQFACVFRDVTERAEREKLATRLGHISELLSHLHKTIFRAGSREELLSSARSVSVGGGALRLRWVGMSGGADEFLCPVNCQAFEQARPVVGPPPTTVCPIASCRQQAHSCAAFPIRLHGKVCGTLCLDAQEEGFFGEREKKRVEEAALDLSLALDKLDAESRHREAEQHLTREREFARAVLENVADGVVACDAGGRTAFLNRTAREWHAAGLLDADGRTPIAPDSFPLSRAFSGELLRNTPITVAAQGLAPRSLLASGSAFYDAEGEKLGAVVALRDITDHENAQRLLRESEERWQFALEGAGHGVWDVNIPTGRSHYSRQWKAMLGFDEDDVGDSQQDWEQRVHPDDKADLRVAMDRHLAGETPYYACEFRMLCKDGSWKWILGRGKVMTWDSDGKPVRVVGTHTDITERRLAEQKLRESEERFRLISENTSDVIWLFEVASQQITYVSPSVFRLRGFSPEEAVAMTLEQSLTPASRQFALAQLQRRIAAFEAGDESARVGVDEMEHPCKDGSVVVTEAATTLLTNSEGRVCEVLGVSRDITERKMAEETLRNSRKQLAEAMELANLVPWQFDLATGLFTFDDRFFELCGTSARFEGGYQMTPETYCREFVHPDDKQLVADVMAGDLEKYEVGRRDKVEHRIVRRDGEVRHIVVRFEVSKDASGRPLAITGANQDITERRRTEEELRRSETRFRILTNDAPMAICIARRGRLIYANPAFLVLTGYASLSQAEGLPLLDFVARESRRRAAEHVRLRSKGRPAPEKQELVGRRKDGSEFPMQIAVNVMHVSDGPALVAFVEDMTAQKKVEAERERLHAQLLQAQKMESIGRLAGGIAHDFNNLLTVINGYSALTLSRLGPADPSRAAVDHIRRAGERATALVRQLLAFSRKQVLQPEVLDLNQVVRDVSKVLPHLMGEDVEVVANTYQPVHLVMADRQQIEQVIMNLVVNARDAMPNGGKLTIETRNELTDDQGTPRGHVRLTVRDTGTGMDEQTRAHLFEPFFTTKGTGKGSGLGLATVHGIVAQSQGHIDVETAVDRGTAFHIFLPSVEPVFRNTAEGDSAALAMRGIGTILLVEDQAEVRRFVATVLENHGYIVLQASEGSEALEICGAQIVDLLVTDIVMPKMNGVELAKRARQMQPSIKTLFMSGYSSPTHDTTVGALEPFIQKPFTPDAIATKVRDLLGAPKVKAKVLIVDDEDGIRAFLRATLEAAGYEVHEAADGKQAIRQMRSVSADLVVTDLVMPEQEGIATIRQLRRDHPHVGIIAISGANGGQYLGMARPLGADAALPKPLEAGALLSEAKRVLEMFR